MADRLRSSANPLLYLYGITQEPASLPASVRGVDGVAAVESLDCSGFTCWVSRVSRDEFGDKLAQNMEKLEWLADASVRHQRVVGGIHEQREILPARFGTVFLHEQSLADDIAARKAALIAGFRRIAGADEWGVRVFAEPRAVSVATGARSGKEYLKRKSALLQSKPPRTLEPEIQQFASALVKLATACAQGGKVGAGQSGLRWQTSLLLPRSRGTKFQTLLSRFANRWQERFRLEVTGPWPPYSFVGDDAQAQPHQSVQKRPMRRNRADGVAR